MATRPDPGGSGPLPDRSPISDQLDQGPILEAGVTEALSYPNRPGAQNRDTSQSAADALAPKVARLRDMTLAIFERAGSLTADQAAARMGLSILSIRPRVTELARLGRVKDTGERRPNASGRNAIVWSVTR
jgi:hypothetical protein